MIAWVWDFARAALFGSLCAGLTFWFMNGAPRAVLAEAFAWAAGGAALAWALAFYGYGKVAELTDLEGLDHRQQARLEVVVAQHTHRLWAQGLLLLVSAAATAAPALLTKVKVAPPDYVFWIAGAGVGIVVSCVLRSYFLVEGTRRFKSEMRQLDRRERERRQHIESLTAGQ